MSKVSLLSTKMLSLEQRMLLENHNFNVTEYNAITIDSFSVKKKSSFKNVIVTSQNAARILIQNSIQIENIFCVGEKTKSLFIANKYNVKEVSENAISLANLIVKSYREYSFVFFCGNLRRVELPELLLKEKILFSEEIIYNTNLNVCQFDVCFDAVLFFSPSGVRSFIKNNNISNSVAFCIGKTTEDFAKKYALKTVKATNTSIDATLKSLIDYFKA